MTRIAPTVVLVHGAFRGGWSWEEVARGLVSAGVGVVAPDLLGAGERWQSEQSPVRLRDVAADLAGTVAAIDAPVVLVGHSQGALVVRHVLGDPPDNLAAVAYLDGAVPAAGERAVDLLGGHEPEPDLLVQPPPPAADLPAAVRELLAERTRPQHAAMALGRVPEVACEVPTTWAFCARTPPTYPSATTRRRLDAAGVAYTLLDAPHDAPLLAPDAVQAWLRDVVLPSHAR